MHNVGPYGFNRWAVLLIVPAAVTLFCLQELLRHPSGTFRGFEEHSGRYRTADPVGLAGGMNRQLYAEGDPLSASDPEGLWSTPGHDASIDLYFGAGMSPAEVRWIKDGSRIADSMALGFQRACDSYMHAMSSGCLSKEEALVKYCQHIGEQMEKFRLWKDSQNMRFRRLAYVSLGIAMHAVMDSSSPVHRGFQQWNWGSAHLHGPKRVAGISRPDSKEDVDALGLYRQEMYARMDWVFSGRLPEECSCR